VHCGAANLLAIAWRDGDESPPKWRSRYEVDGDKIANDVYVGSTAEETIAEARRHVETMFDPRVRQARRHRPRSRRWLSCGLLRSHDHD
jgi:hypothetical protein